ncbi:Ig-like domain-containing protein [Xylophilus sp. GOD-11R]|uniref:Ig-like domain-containing protein n=1 Tax=Xylophilus sp. GOD-11R TaxID=3089814 RepID=UPI00298C0F44|nr:Ig-like domain-containing protein [Xylophilus sp. GOD-11R]WPB56143.1 Ig-like domain-containing protein [Xylophilus sp. GOD-11R]
MSTSLFTIGNVNYSFVALGPAAANSSVSVTRNGQSANGVSSDVLSATIRNAANSPIANTSVTFAATSGVKFGSGTTGAAGSCTTDANGSCSVDATSTKAASYSSQVSAGSVKLGTLSYNFVALEPSAGKSSIAVTTNGQIANGSAADVLQATIRDSSNYAVPGATVTFAATSGVRFGSGAYGAAGTCSTDTSGVCSVKATSTVAASYSSSVSVGGSAIGTLSYNFIAGAASAAGSGVRVVTNSAIADGVKTDVLEVLIRDANNNPVGSTSVAFASPGADVAFDGSTRGSAGSCTTAATGLCRVDATSSSISGGSKKSAVTVGGIALAGTFTAGGNSYKPSPAGFDFVALTASLAKSFSPSSFSSGATANVVLTLTNPATTLAASASFTDTLPASLMVAATPAIGGTCSNATSTGVVTATAGGGTIKVAGVNVPAGGSCTVTVAVTNKSGSTNGNCTSNPTAFTNSASNISGMTGVTVASGTSSSACVTIPPAATAKSGVRVTTNSQLADGSSADVLEVMVRDDAGTPVGGQVVTFAATPGVNLGAGVGAAATCTTAATTGLCSVSAKSTTVGSKSTAVSLAAGAVANAFTVSGASYTASPVSYGFVAATASLAKSFNPSSFSSGGTTNVVLTLTNPATTLAASASFTDTLPTSLMVAATPAIGGTCSNAKTSGVVTATASGSTIQVAGVAVPAGGSCTVTVAVTNRSGSTNGNCTSNPTAFTNSSTNISSTTNVTVTSGSGSSACVTIPPPQASHSGVRMVTDGQLADGSATNRIEAMVRDDADKAVGGQAVTFAATPEVNLGAGVGVAGSCVTGLDGTCHVDATSTKPGTRSTAVSVAGNAVAGSFTIGASRYTTSPAGYKFVLADLRLAISQPSPALAVGAISTVTATLSNGGDATASAGSAKLLLPTGVALEGSSGTGWTCSAASAGIVPCSFSGSIAPGASTTLQWRLKPDASVAGKDVTVGYSVGTGSAPPPAPSGCTDTAHCASATYAVGSGISLGIAITGPSPAPAVGVSSFYSLTVTNHGTGAANGARIKMRMPGSVAYGTARAGSGWACRPAATLAPLPATEPHEFFCDYTGTIAPGSNTTVVQIPVQPKTEAAGITLAPDVSVGRGGGSAEPPTPGSGCTDTVACATADKSTVASGISLSIRLSSPVPTLAVGADSVYTLTVTNNGTGPASTAQAKVKLPTDVAYRSASGTGWSCSANTSNLLTCNYSGSIAAAGGTAVASITVRPAAGSTGETVAPGGSVGDGGGQAPDPGPGCTSATACTTAPSVTVGSGISLGIAIAGPTPALVVGVDSAYALTVTNHGSGAASAAHVKLQLPASVAYQSASGTGWSCSANAANLVSCDFNGTIAAAAHTAVTVTVRPATAAAGTSVAPPASVGKASDQAPAPGTTCTDTTACATAAAATVGSGISLSIRLSSPVPTLAVGADSVYTLTVTNNGTGPASTAQAKVKLPTDVAYRSASGTGWSCSANTSNLLTCNYSGSIAAAGGTAVASITVRPAAGSTGETVAPGGSVGDGGGQAPDPGPGCTSATACTTAPSVTVGSGISLGIAIAGPTPALVVGVDSTWTATVTNHGTGSDSGAHIKMRLPQSMAYRSVTGVGWTCSAATNVAVGVTGVGTPQELSCAFAGTIAAGASSAVRLTFKPAAEASGTSVAPAVSVGKADGTTQAPTPGTTCTDTVACATATASTVGSGIALSIRLSSPAPALAVGADSVYTLTATNNGTGPAPTAQAKVQLPTSLAYRSASGTGWSCAANAANLVTCNYSGSIAAGGGTAAAALTVRPNTGSTGETIAPGGTIGEGGGQAPDPGSSCTSTTACTTAPAVVVGSGIVLGIAIAGPAPALVVGVDSAYTITVTNHGSGPAGAAHVKLQLPASVAYRSASGNGWTCAANADNLLSCDFTGTIAAAANTAVAVTVKPAASASGTSVAPPASVGKGSEQAPAPGSSCTDTIACTTASASTVGSGIALSIRLSSPVPTLAVGADSVYMLTVTNNGTGPAPTAQAKVKLPASVAYRSASGTGWSCSADAAHLVTCQYSGSIAAAGGTTAVALTVRPDTGANGETVAPGGSVGEGGGQAPDPGASCTSPTACITAPSVVVGNGISLGIAIAGPAPALVVGVDSLYTVTVTNHGTGPDSGAHVKVQLPASVDYRTVSGAGWTCAADEAHLVSCVFSGAIAAGAHSAATLTVRPDAAASGTRVAPSASVGRNDGSASAPTPGATCTDRVACATATASTVGSGIALSIRLSAPVPALAVGADSVYTLTATNRGTGPSPTAQAKVRFPKTVEFRSGIGTGWRCAADATNLVTCDYAGSIAPAGGSTTVALTVRPTPAATGEPVGPGGSIGEDGGPAPEPGTGCTDPEACTNVPSAVVGSGIALGITIAGPTPGLVVGMESAYTLTVTNHGSGPDSGAHVKVQLPEALAYQRVTGTGWTCAEDAAHLLACDFTGTLQPGASTTATLAVLPQLALADQQVSLATSVGQDSGAAPAPGAGCTNTSACAVSPPAGVANGVALSIRISPPTPALTVDQDSAYTVTVTNNGSGAAIRAQVKLQLPAGMTYRGGEGEHWHCAIDAAQLVTCDFAGGQIAPRGGSSVVSVTVRPTDALSGSQVTVPASVGRDGGAAPQPDGQCTDSEACAVAPAAVVGGGVGMTIAKTASRQQAAIGDTVVYAVTVAYPGQGVARDVVVEDRLPAGFRYVPGTLTMRHGAAGAVVKLPDPGGASGPVMSIAVGDLPSREHAELSYRVRIGIGAQRGTGVNHARARSSNGLASGEARSAVEVTGGVFTTDACILGKVFTDCDGNGEQNGDRDIGIPQAKVYLEDGTNITTDMNGNFSICGMRPITHAMRVDPASLPAGSTMLATSNRNAGDAGSLFVDLKNGELHRADFAVQACSATQREEILQRARALESVENDPKQRQPDFGLRFESDRTPRTPPGQLVPQRLPGR